MGVNNLRKALKKWDGLKRVLGQEGENTQVWGNFFKAVVRSVLLFRLEKWLTNPYIVRALWGFHNRVAQRIMGRKTWRCPDKRWHYPPLGGDYIGGRIGGARGILHEGS